MMNETLARKKRDALIMANARRLIKAPVKTTNWVLYSELFGTGSTTAAKSCRDLGLEPDSNQTDRHEMDKYLTGRQEYVDLV